MKLAIKKATVDVSVYVFIQNSSLTTGAGLTGLVFNSASLVCYYVRPLAAAAALTLATQTVTGAHSDGGFVEVDATNMPGVYRLDLSDAICATGVNSVVVMLKGATNMAPVLLEIQLVSYDPNDAVRLGLTALPNAAADAAGGLPISDAGGLDLDARLDAAITSRLAPTTAGRTLDVTATGAAGIDWGNVENPTTAVNLSATNIDVDQVVASVSGAVGSVTGAVGSVTGNVGGNVVGSVASVTAGVTLAASAVQAIWDALTSALTTVGSIGKLLVDNINATISSRLPTASYTAPLDAAGTRAAVGLASANLDTQLDALPTAAENATAVWDRDATAHQTQGTFGQAIGDPGADTDTIFGLVNTNLDAAVSTRLATAGYTTPLDAAGTRTAVGLASANLDTQLDALPTANENADALLDRSAGVETNRTPRQALRLMLASLAGKLSGAATTTVAIRDTNDSKDRITATVDANGNRTAVTYDAS